MPDSAQCECQESSVLFGYTLIDKRTQPAISAAVPVLNGIAHVGSELLDRRERKEILI